MSDRGFYLACCQGEHPRFRSVFEAIPNTGLDWRPEPKSRSTRELVGHMLGHDLDLIQLIDEGRIDHRMQVQFDDMAQAIQIYDDASSTLDEKLASMDDEAWGRTAQMWVGDYMALEGSTAEMMWGFLFDSIHHRGQLSTYLRPIGSKVPSIYGPSADTQDA